MGKYSISKAFVAITSTREEFINAPNDVFKQIVKLLDASLIDPYDFYGVPCANVNNAPDLVFIVENRQLTISKNEYIRKVSFLHHQ